MKTLATIGIMALAGLALAAVQAPKNLYRYVCSDGSQGLSCTDYDTLNGVDAGTDEATRSVTVPVGGYSRLVQHIYLADANTDCSTMVVTCHSSGDAGTTWAQLTTEGISSGVVTLSEAHHTIARDAVTTDATIIYDVRGMIDVKCTYSTTGTCSGDTLTAQWILSAGQ